MSTVVYNQKVRFAGIGFLEIGHSFLSLIVRVLGRNLEIFLDIEMK